MPLFPKIELPVVGWFFQIAQIICLIIMYALLMAFIMASMHEVGGS